MYPFLCRHLPRPAADAVVVAWYVLLIVLVAAGFSLPVADFRYAGL